mgnify:CR=1 FL=1
MIVPDIRWKADWRIFDPDHWQKGAFTVPKEIRGKPVTEQDVEDRASAFRNKFGRFLELEGWTVLSIEGPTLDSHGLQARMIVDKDRRRYIMWAKVEKAPMPWLLKDVPDKFVEALLKSGLKLK